MGRGSDSVGIWIQTKADDMALWKRRITESLNMYGYRVEKSNDFDRSIHMEFKKGLLGSIKFYGSMYFY